MSHDPRDDAERIVGIACGAPSVHNTQPWSWRVRGDTVELHRDPGRRLEVEDPDGRDLVISCGAALHHAVVVARALRWTTAVSRLPDGPGSTLLATLRLLGRRPGAVDRTGLELVETRRTDRRRFTSWPVPAHRLETLAGLAEERGASARVVEDPSRRFRLWMLVERARELQAADPRAVAEQRSWTRATSSCVVDGVPAAAVPAPGERGMTTRFREARTTGPGDDLRGADGVIVLGGAADDELSWLQVGEGLSALWLDAWRTGLSVVPLSQPVEVSRTRAAIRDEVLTGAFWPHLVVRVGWQALGRDPLLRTPRRPLGDVLRP